jgi:hypothetical protein
MSKFTETQVEELLGEIIYTLAERDFDCIKYEFFNKHLNRNEPFSKKQVESITGLLNGHLEFHDLQLVKEPNSLV